MGAPRDRRAVLGDPSGGRRLPIHLAAGDVDANAALAVGAHRQMTNPAIPGPGKVGG